MIGASGEAIGRSGVLQVRAFDWNTDFGLQSEPLLIVYHSSVPGSVQYSLTTWAGIIFALTGVNENQLGVGQIGISCPHCAPYFGEDSRRGMPFPFVLKYILGHEQHMSGADAFLQKVRRTCNILVGVGSGLEGDFAGYQYSATVLRRYNDSNLEPVGAWHPRFPVRALRTASVNIFEC